MSIARLEPVHRPDEILRQPSSGRSSFTITKSGACDLGRKSGSPTGISDDRINRRVCVVSWNNAVAASQCRERQSSFLLVRGAKDDSIFYINGRLYKGTSSIGLHDGDVLALWKNEDGVCTYAYTVVVEPSSLQKSPNRKRNAAATQSTPGSLCSGVTQTHQAASNASHKAVGQELICPVCLDIQVQSTMLIPCGHYFCKVCCKEAQDCPMCKTTIQRKQANRMADNIVGSLLSAEVGTSSAASASSANSFFGEDDIETYIDRAAKVGLMVLPEKRKQNRLPRKKRPRRSAGRTRTGKSVEEAICIDS